MTTGRGYEDFMLKNNARAFLEHVDFRKCQKWLLEVLDNN
jgi:hypothetical protein